MPLFTMRVAASCSLPRSANRDCPSDLHACEISATYAVDYSKIFAQDNEMTQECRAKEQENMENVMNIAIKIACITGFYTGRLGLAQHEILAWVHAKL